MIVFFLKKMLNSLRRFVPSFRFKIDAYIEFFLKLFNVLNVLFYKLKPMATAPLFYILKIIITIFLTSLIFFSNFIYSFLEYLLFYLLFYYYIISHLYDTFILYYINKILNYFRQNNYFVPYLVDFFNRLSFVLNLFFFYSGGFIFSLVYDFLLILCRKLLSSFNVFYVSLFYNFINKFVFISNLVILKIINFILFLCLFFEQILNYCRDTNFSIFLIFYKVKNFSAYLIIVKNGAPLVYMYNFTRSFIYLFIYLKYFFLIIVDVLIKTYDKIFLKLLKFRNFVSKLGSNFYNFFITSLKYIENLYFANKLLFKNIYNFSFFKIFSNLSLKINRKEVYEINDFELTDSENTSVIVILKFKFLNFFYTNIFLSKFNFLDNVLISISEKYLIFKNFVIKYRKFPKINIEFFFDLKLFFLSCFKFLKFKINNFHNRLCTGFVLFKQNIYFKVRAGVLNVVFIVHEIKEIFKSKKIKAKMQKNFLVTISAFASLIRIIFANFLSWSIIILKWLFFLLNEFKWTLVWCFIWYIDESLLTWKGEDTVTRLRRFFEKFWANVKFIFWDLFKYFCSVLFSRAPLLLIAHIPVYFRLLYLSFYSSLYFAKNKYDIYLKDTVDLFQFRLFIIYKTVCSELKYFYKCIYFPTVDFLKPALVSLNWKDFPDKLLSLLLLFIYIKLFKYFLLYFLLCLLKFNLIRLDWNLLIYLEYKIKSLYHKRKFWRKLKWAVGSRKILRKFVFRDKFYIYFNNFFGRFLKRIWKKKGKQKIFYTIRFITGSEFVGNTVFFLLFKILIPAFLNWIVSNVILDEIDYILFYDIISRII